MRFEESPWPFFVLNVLCDFALQLYLINKNEHVKEKRRKKEETMAFGFRFVLFGKKVKV